MAEDDAPDERLAGSVPERLRGLLDVEPLDELTRRRLVTTAVRASAPPSRSRRWVAAAAAVVALAIGGGVALLATGGDDTSAPTALNDQENKSATPNATPPAESLNDQSSASDQASPSAGATSASPAYAGSVGDLAVAADLAAARAKLGSPSLIADSQGPSASGLGPRLAADLAKLPCAADLPRGRVIAVATATFGAAPALVVVTDLADGTRSIVAVLSDPCEVRPLD